MEGKKLNFNAPLLSVRVNRKTRETPRPKRQLSVPSHKSDWELTEVTEPAAVPFVWERTPGRSKTQSPPPKEHTATPRFPPGRPSSGEQVGDVVVFRPQTEVSPLNGNVNVININEDCGSQSEEDTFSDALETLLETDSFYDGSCAESSITFRADPQTRDFMMARFLPAARAMVIEMPQFVPIKHPEVSESPKPIKKIVSGELRPLLERYESNAALYQSQYKGSVGSEHEEDKCDNRDRKSGKTFGLFPRLCVKNSLCLLNPIPGMKSRAQSPISTGPEVRRMPRTAHSGPLPQTHHEKHDWNGTYWKNIQSGVKSKELVENKPTDMPIQSRHSSDSCMAEGLSPHRRCISPYRNEKPRSPFYDGARFLGIPKIIKYTEADKLSSISKGSDKFRDISSPQKYKQGSDSFSTLVEKTLYVDSVNNAEVPKLDSVSSKAGGLDLISKETLVESRGSMEEFSTPKSFTHGDRRVKPEVNENLVNKTEGTEKTNNQGNLIVGLESPRPPPLPKSPSESWLSRNLHSISLRNPISQVQRKKQGKKISTTGAKWETIVKTSQAQHDHKRYSEELISHVSRHPKP